MLMMNPPDITRLIMESNGGPILFTRSILPLGNDIRKQAIYFNCNADDTQL